MLSATKLTKSYSTLKVLNGVDLEVGGKEILSIVGASGAGKSTLLHILGTLDLSDGGDLLIDETRVADLSSQQLASFRNKKLGFVFQFHNLLPEFTALENVCLPGFIGGRPEKAVRSRATELLNSLGLGKRALHKPSELSGGEQQRVAVARSLINDPAIIFADEPSGNLDSKNAEELHKLFFKLRDDFDKTFVIVTHNPELAQMSDRKVEIADGVIASA
ncbi:lipoprotein ABC transporter ATP-binding protein [Roseivirga misakiensis]|uniref:Lipoprotein ABC transporter ATP-binding protein n=1 Tax=Roseivirga misakiensis TaxID=1563681 RepID=A0A1E5T2Z7_9BACT|nr:lipoprotein ABC transporter ATP-binding protein [Roseivirga misakiensis]